MTKEYIHYISRWQKIVLEEVDCKGNSKFSLWTTYSDKYFIQVNYSFSEFRNFLTNSLCEWSELEYIGEL